MQIAFVRTSHPPPLIPVPPSRHTAASLASSDPRLVPFSLPRPSFSRSLSFSPPPSFYPHFSPLFLVCAPSPARSPPRLCASLARSLAPSRNIHFPPRPQTSVDLSRARESERQKCFDDCVPWRLFLYFCRGGGIPGWAGLLPPPPPPPPPRIGG